MKLRRLRQAGFTLVEIMIVVAIIGLLAAIAIPNFVKARNTAQSNACVNNLRQIDSAIQQWALENNKKDNDTVAAADITTYIKNGVPTCPAGGVAYTIVGTVDANPSVICQNAVAATATTPAKHTLGP